MQTRIRQEQIRKSNQPEDSLPLPEYSELKTLEDDLNYIRSVIRDFKGTQSYDSPVIEHLEEIRHRLETMLEGATIGNLSLVNAKAETRDVSDNTDAVATTEFVHNVVNASTELGDLHRPFPIDTKVESFKIQHNMNKYPAVQFLDSSGREKIVEVEHHSVNDLTIHFGKPRTGTAILN